MTEDEIRDVVANYILELVSGDAGDSLHEAEGLDPDFTDLAYKVYDRAKVTVVIDEVEYNGN